MKSCSGKASPTASSQGATRIPPLPPLSPPTCCEPQTALCWSLGGLSHGKRRPFALLFFHALPLPTARCCLLGGTVLVLSALCHIAGGLEDQRRGGRRDD